MPSALSCVGGEWVMIHAPALRLRAAARADVVQRRAGILMGETAAVRGGRHIRSATTASRSNATVYHGFIWTRPKQPHEWAPAMALDSPTAAKTKNVASATSQDVRG